MSNNLRIYFAEAIGTFILVFAGTGAVIINDIRAGAVTGVGIGLTFGLVVMVMVYAIGDISGAHINPAVTIGFCFARGFQPLKASFYILFQIVGALLASMALRLLFPNHLTLGATLPGEFVWLSAILEFFLSFMLMFVVLSVTTSNQDKKFIAPVAIGATVGLEALFAGPISGASMNPARSIGPAVASGHFEHLWIYIFTPICGAIFACFVAASIRPNQEFEK